MTSFAREAQAGTIRAAAVCVDVRTVPPGQTEKRDAICTQLEHENGETADSMMRRHSTGLSAAVGGRAVSFTVPVACLELQLGSGEDYRPPRPFCSADSDATQPSYRFRL
jgi:hypothetical protein